MPFLRVIVASMTDIGRSLQPGLSWLLRQLHRLEDSLIVFVLLGMILLAVWQILLRNLFSSSLVWIEPLLQNAVLWIGLLAAMIASRKDEHIRIDMAATLLPARFHPYLTSVVDVFTAAMCLFVSYHSALFVWQEYQFSAPAFANVPSWLLQSILPVGFFSIGLRYLVLFIQGLQGKRPPMRDVTP